MKRIKPLLLLTFVSVLLFSCNRDQNSPESRAKELCDCAHNMDWFNETPTDAKRRFLEGDAPVTREELTPCALKVWKKIDADLLKLNDVDLRVDYTKRLMKAFIDTECTDKLLRIFPYESMRYGLEEMEHYFYERQERRREFEEEMDELKLEDAYPEDF